MDIQKIKKILVTHRMFSTRILIALFLFFLVFSRPLLLHENSVYEYAADLIGALLIIICVLGRVYCSVFIGGKKNKKLITEGPFALVRNPLYVFSFVGIIGVGLQTSSFFILSLLIGIFMLYYPHVVAKEEKVLSDTFGESYLQYMATVPRWVPKHASFSLPESTVSSPKVILATLMDASLFFLIYPLMEILEYVHQMNWLPILFHIP